MASGFRADQPGLRKLLGDLEAAIMEEVWASPVGTRVAVRDVYEALRLKRTIAYTTVMTVMTNLAKKNVLVAEKAGKAHLYHAPLSREAFTEQAVGRIVDELFSDFSEAAVAHFSRVLDTPKGPRKGPEGSEPLRVPLPGQPDALAKLKARVQAAQADEPTDA
jgi:predicted transcriptional regulator